MATYYRTQGYILKKTDWREADQLFTIFTEDFGKLKILGRSIRKIKSKLRSGIGSFYLSEVEFIQGKAYKTLTGVVLINKFENIRSDLVKLKVASRITDCLDGLVNGQEQDAKIWNLLTETFNGLNNCLSSATYYSLLYYYFLWNLFSTLGYQIDLYNCALCQKKLIPTKLYFSPEQGGILCTECYNKANDRIDISLEVIKILRLLTEKNKGTLSRLKIQDVHKISLKEISNSYFSFVENKYTL